MLAFVMGGASEVSALIFVFVQFYRPIWLEKLNTTVGLLPTICRDTRVLSRVLAAPGSLQLGSCVCHLVESSLLPDHYSWALVSVT